LRKIFEKKRTKKHKIFLQFPSFSPGFSTDISAIFYLKRKLDQKDPVKSVGKFKGILYQFFFCGKCWEIYGNGNRRILIVENGEISKDFSNNFFCGNVWENCRKNVENRWKKLGNIFRRFGKI
jgi:hypothetical protein